MIENVETFNCGDSRCGRKFADFESLLEHYRRRHQSLYKTYEKRRNFFDELSNQIENFEKDSKEAFIIDKEREEIMENSMIQINDHEEAENLFESELNFQETNSADITVTSTSKQIEPKKEIDEEKEKFQKLATVSEEMIGLGSNYIDYNEIEEIDLEEKNIMCFRHKRNLNFNCLTYLVKINLSKNFIKDISDLRHLTSIIHLNVSNNLIDDISSLEYLESLEDLNAENNEIRSISSLNKCRNLKCLLLRNNKIMYEQSTYSTIQFLKNLKELSIRNNTFLDDVLGYKHLFVDKYTELERLDHEDIKELDREIASRFMAQSSGMNENQNERIVQKVKIEKIEYIKEVSLREVIKPKSSHPIQKVKLMKTSLSNSNDNQKIDYHYLTQIDLLRKELRESRADKEKLLRSNKNFELEINSLNIELENVSNLNKEYEKLIDDLKNKKNDHNELNHARESTQEVEMWKREYFDLLNKNMNANSYLLTNASTNFLTEMNNTKRPQTSFQTQGLNMEKYFNTSLSINFRNSLDDSLDNIIEDVSDLQIEKEKLKDNEDEEIEELLRKSTSNLKTLKDEIKSLNKEINKTEPIPKSTNVNKEIIQEKKLNPITLRTKNISQSKPNLIRDNIEAKIKLPNVFKIKK